MRLYTEVSYAIYDNSKLHKAETIGLMHDRAINNSVIKIFLKKRLDKHKKNFKIDITSKEMLSEEDAFSRYRNNLINIEVLRRPR